MPDASHFDPTLIPLLSQDVAYVEHTKQVGWVVHYRMFIDWGSRCVVCEGLLPGFTSYDSAIGWIFDTFPAITLISKQEFTTERKSVSRYQ